MKLQEMQQLDYIKILKTCARNRRQHNM